MAHCTGRSLSSTSSLQLLIAVCPLLVTGCAFGYGGGLGLTADTRGGVGVLASAHVYPWGIRVEPKKTPGKEAAMFLMPCEVSSGAMIDPGAGLLRVDMPFMGFARDTIADGQGFAGRLNPRFEMLWPFDGADATSAYGAAAHFGWLQHLSSKKAPRLASRPEWPDGWETHQLGPVFDAAVMREIQGGWYGTFTISAVYRYLAYFSMGL